MKKQLKNCSRSRDKLKVASQTLGNRYLPHLARLYKIKYVINLKNQHISYVCSDFHAEHHNRNLKEPVLQPGSRSDKDSFLLSVVLSNCSSGSENAVFFIPKLHHFLKCTNLQLADHEEGFMVLYKFSHLKPSLSVCLQVLYKIKDVISLKKQEERMATLTKVIKVAQIISSTFTFYLLIFQQGRMVFC